jgi:hypothetical protein
LAPLTTRGRPGTAIMTRMHGVAQKFEPDYGLARRMVDECTEAYEFSAPPEQRFREARAALHELIQPITLMVGIIELIGVSESDTSAHVNLSRELQATATSLIDRTEKLRAILQGA